MTFVSTLEGTSFKTLEGGSCESYNAFNMFETQTSQRTVCGQSSLAVGRLERVPRLKRFPIKLGIISGETLKPSVTHALW